MRKEVNLGKLFDEFKDYCFVNYRGFIVEVNSDGSYLWKNDLFLSASSVAKAINEYIEQGGNIINQSIDKK